MKAIYYIFKISIAYTDGNGRFFMDKKRFSKYTVLCNNFITSARSMELRIPFALKPPMETSV
jgi:hypothetical protein